VYTFKPASARILKLREEIRDRVLRHESERARIITEASKQYENVTPIIRRPLMHYELCKRMTLYIGDDELIVGSKGPHQFSCPSFIEQFPPIGEYHWMFQGIRGGEWQIGDDGLYHNPGGEELRHSVAPEDFEYLVEAGPYWRDKWLGVSADVWKPEAYDELARLNVSSYVNFGIGLAMLTPGHLVAGYKKIINTGYAAIRKQAQDWIDAHWNDLMGEDMEKYLFYRSAVIACDAAMLLVKRYAKACADKAAECGDAKRKAELARMADGLLWLSENPARNFWEACQGIMMYQVFIVNFEAIPSPSFGRFDQYVWPFLEKDLAAGTVTLDEAQETVDAFFLKANCFYEGAAGKLSDTTGIGNTYQHTTIGGVDPETGEDATNPVTYMVLETMGRLKLHDPTISLRINKDTPEKLWECALETSKAVGGLPLFQNDEIIIQSLVEELDFELKDARDYGLIGCQEIVGCGTDYPAPNGSNPPHASIWWGSVLNMAINDGTNPLNGEQARLRTGYLYDMKSIEEVREALTKMGRYIFKLFITVNNYTEYIVQRVMPEAPLSVSIEGCMEKGRDVISGGAKYNSYGGTATGLATLADALTTIKYMVFDKKLCTARELYDAFIANWEGHEILRQRILAEVPHFGNGDPYADMEMKFVCDLYYELCGECSSMRCKVYKAGLYGASDHIAQGRITWATPDGRRYGEPLADAASPAQGRDKLGPITVFNSSVCYDHSHYMGGIALNLRMHPSVLSNDQGVAKLRDATKVYFKQGGLEVQYNVVNTETLKKAQENPAEYRDLVVRIAGYSAYFIELGRDLQNDIIARNENRL
jgi:formate C-acetyltransferase